MKKIFIVVLSTFAIISCETKMEEKKGDVTTTKTDTEVTVPAASANNAPVTKWMSWEGGIDLAAITDTSFKQPNIIIHCAKLVNTPVGSAASGMILYQPDAKQPPMAMGFVSTNKTVGEYFGPNIFAGTPFEKAPILNATFNFVNTSDKSTAKIVTSGHTFEVEMSEFEKPYLIQRAPSAMPPFHQQGVEIKPKKVVFKVDGKEVTMILPPMGITGGPAAVLSPNGVYAR